MMMKTKMKNKLLALADLEYQLTGNSGAYEGLDIYTDDIPDEAFDIYSDGQEF